MNNTDIESITAYIFADGVSEENCKKFMELGRQYGREIVLIDAQETLNRLKKMSVREWNGSITTYGRAFCMDIVPKRVERLITIDADTVVVGNLRPALEHQFDDNSVIAMAKESLCVFLPKDDFRYGHYNAGFVIYNTKKWRDEGWTDKLLWHIENVKSDYRAAEQDLLNIVCKGHIAQLPPEFNFLPIHRAFSDKVFFSKPVLDYYSPAEVSHAHKFPIVIHMYRFLGARPWQKNTPHPDRELFDEYLRKSPWKGYVKQPIEKSALFQIERIMYKIIPQKMFFNIFIFVQNLLSIIDDRKDTKKAKRRCAEGLRKQ